MSFWLVQLKKNAGFDSKYGGQFGVIYHFQAQIMFPPRSINNQNRGMSCVSLSMDSWCHNCCRKWSSSNTKKAASKID
jgi:hypothetical protein